MPDARYFRVTFQTLPISDYTTMSACGTMLDRERNRVFPASYLVFFPGLAIMITILVFNLLGDGIHNTIDPRLTNKKS